MTFLNIARVSVRGGLGLSARRFEASLTDNERRYLHGQRVNETPMGGTTVREVTAGDKEEILQINRNLYDGLDYLNDYIDDFIKCPYMKLYKAVYEGEIVGFTSATLVDDGNTVVIRASRVNPQFQQRGVFKMLYQYLLKMSTAGHLAFISSSDLKLLTTQWWIQEEFKLIVSMPTRRFDLTLLPRDKLVSSKELPSTLTKDMLKRYMTSDKYRGYLFPQDRVVVDSIPFKVIMSNIEILWTRDEHSLRLTDVKLVDGKMKGLLSISTSYMGLTGTLVCTIDIFGTDSSSIKQHIMAHLDFVRHLAVTDSSVLVVTDPAFEISVIENLFKQIFNLMPVNWKFSGNPDNYETECGLYEKRLKGV